MLVEYTQSGRTLRVRLSGEMNEKTVLAAADEFRRRCLSDVVRSVEIDFCELTRATILGRSAFTELQSALGNAGKRTAYLADSPRFRGTAIWIVKMSGDENASVFARADQVAEWLDANQERTAGRVEGVLRWKGDR